MIYLRPINTMTSKKGTKIWGGDLLLVTPISLHSESVCDQQKLADR